jgi:putative phage-type endonuclease
LDYEQGSIEWKIMRSSKITGTDAPVILHQSPYKTPFQLWQEKIGIYETPMNDAMKHGIEKEPIARSKLEDHLEESLIPAVVQSIENPWCIASLDGISLDGEIIVEIKCPKSNRIFMEAKDDKVPSYYVAQVQHQLYVSQAAVCLFCVYYEGDIEFVTVIPDKNFWSQMIEKEQEFLKFVENLTPPPIDW